MTTVPVIHNVDANNVFHNYQFKIKVSPKITTNKHIDKSGKGRHGLRGWER